MLRVWDSPDNDELNSVHEAESDPGLVRGVNVLVATLFTVRSVPVQLVERDCGAPAVFGYFGLRSWG